MGFMDKLKGLTKGREKQISGAVDKAGDFVDKKTKGKYTGQIDSVEGKVDDALGERDTPKPATGRDTPGPVTPAS